MSMKCSDKDYSMETGYSCGIYWVFAENLTACIIDSPKIRNPMGNLIRTQRNWDQIWAMRKSQRISYLEKPWLAGWPSPACFHTFALPPSSIQVINVHQRSTMPPQGMPSRKSLVYQRFVFISSYYICRDLPRSITIALRFVAIDC